MPRDAFMDAIFDDHPLLVSRPDSPRYYAPWFSRAVVDDLLRYAASSTPWRFLVQACKAVQGWFEMLGFGMVA